jgi:hypothetical protein
VRVATLTEAQLFAACTPDLAPGCFPAVRARVACPETGGIKRVRLAMDPVTWRPAVVWCSRYGAHEITCRGQCLQPETADEE